MFRTFVIGLLLLAMMAFSNDALASTCSSYTYTLTNGTTADATQVMSNFNNVLNCANTSLAPVANPSFTGNVGIGTTTPSTKLHIYGGASGGSPYSPNSDTFLTIENNGRSVVQFLSPSSADTEGFYFGTQATPVKAQFTFSPNTDKFGLYDSAVGTFVTFNGTNGYVGIGTTTPSNPLQIAQNSTYTASYASGLRVTNATSPLFGVNIGYDSSAAVGYIQSRQEGIADKNLALNPEGGSVGIGTTSPGQKLSLKGNMSILGASTTETTALTPTYWGYSVGYPVIMLGQASGTQTVAIGYDPSGNTNASFYGDGREVLFRDGVQFATPNAANTAFNLTNLVLKDGSVGIGTTSPAVSLAVVGDIRAGTSGSNGCLQNFAGTALSGTCSSDASLKVVMGSVSSVLDKLASLQLVRFYWNKTAAAVYHNSTTVLNTGFVAQSVERQFPELVSLDVHGYRQLDYTTLSLYGLEAIKESKAAIDRQAAEIAELKSRLAQTDQRLATLEARMGIRTAANDNGIRKPLILRVGK